MTNEQAIKFIQSEYDFESKSVMLARMFAMEDIIEYDVEEWVHMPISSGVSEFVEHTRHANELSISQEAADNLELEKALNDLAHKMEVVMIAMQVYADIQEKIKEIIVKL